MNKRIITAAVLGMVVILIGLVSVTATCVIAEKIEKQAKQLQNDPTDADALELFEKQWEKYEKLLSCYTRHSEIENIGGSVGILKILQQEDEQLFRIECDKIITAAQHMKNTEIPYLRNIL